MAVASARLPISAEEVKAFAIQQGVDCVGIASVGAIPPSVPPRSPLEALPGAKAVVVFGLTTLDGSYQSPQRGIGAIAVASLMGELDMVSYLVARLLERRGYRAAPVAAWC